MAQYYDVKNRASTEGYTCLNIKMFIIGLELTVNKISGL